MITYYIRWILCTHAINVWHSAPWCFCRFTRKKKYIDFKKVGAEFFKDDVS